MRVGSRIFTPHEAVDDPIRERDEPGGASVVFGEHARDADEWQRAIALAGVEMAVRAGHRSAGESRRFVRRVGEDLESPLDLLRDARVVYARDARHAGGVE